ncbi:MAG: selenide, water dikinase SelD [Pseudomonadota bacterium]
MQQNVPIVRDVVLIGGGHSHALVLRKWGMAPVPGARLTLIHPGPTAAYSGMLPGHIAGHYTRSELEIDVIRLARFAGARMIVGKARGLDLAARQVLLTDRAPINFDILSLDVGVTSEMPQIPGFEAHALPAKPLDALATGWEAFVTKAPDGAEIVVIGGGVAGAELAMAVRHRLSHVSAQVTLVERAGALSALPITAAQSMRQTLQSAGITLVEGASVVRLEANAVILGDGRTLPSDCTIGAAGARPHSWVAETGLSCEDGYLVIDPYLRSVDDPTIFAAGDCAHLPFAPRPKAGVFAVRAAPILAHNLRADLIGAQRKSFAPQRDYLKLISLGGKRALGEKSGITVQGDWVWRWKDRIDRAFMTRLSDLPRMPRNAPPRGATKGVAAELAGPDLCGGCGAKVGAGTVAAFLPTLPRGTRDDVALNVGDDAAILRHGAMRQVLSTDHLRAFSADPALVARVALLHAMGDVWAMGADAQAALAHITLPPMRAGMEPRWMGEIMSAASDAAGSLGAEIIGGHSSLGAELQIGFTVTGLLQRDAITVSGGKPGDALVLTRAIGSGVILAADMAARAPGPVVTKLWDVMATSQARAGAILAPVAHAMTDVTGFGLAGHLMDICKNSGLGARLNRSEIPIMDGAMALHRQGFSSRLNASNKDVFATTLDGADAPETALLFDPQTAGGLLAALPQAEAKDVVLQLSQAGYEAAEIGQLTDGPAKITLN